jgi:putative phosphoribosyl transferase
MRQPTLIDHQTRAVRIRSGGVHLNGDLTWPAPAIGLVLFAHGSGSSRHSTRNQFVASVLNQAAIGTLLFDLLTEEEEYEERYTRHLRFDINMLADRLTAATQWAAADMHSPDLPIGYFGASTGGGAALVAAARTECVRAVVSRGGRPDLADDALPSVTAPTLLIVGGNDEQVIELNQRALAQLRCEKKLEIVPAATHLFEEPGTLEHVAELARDWFSHFLPRTNIL